MARAARLLRLVARVLVATPPVLAVPATSIGVVFATWARLLTLDRPAGLVRVPWSRTLDWPFLLPWTHLDAPVVYRA